MTPDEVSAMGKKMAEDIMFDLQVDIENGYVVMHWWDPPLTSKDKIKTYGMKTLVKRYEKEEE